VHNACVVSSDYVNTDVHVAKQLIPYQSTYILADFKQGPHT